MNRELKFIKEVAEDVRKKGGRVYYVGGYVRDKFINKENKDIDVEVYGIELNDLKNLLSKYGSVMEVGASFGILMVKGYDIDFSLPRTENSTGVKHTDFEVKINSKLKVSEATKRRDFTMNAILQDVLTEEYVDLYGGIEDIKNGRIRYVDEETFKEDELRIFRACQFASRFNFSIDDAIKEVGKDFDYKSLSKERIFEEINKALLKSNKPSIAFNYLYELGVVSKLFPELYKIKGCTQGKVHHPEGDVWNHTMMVLDECAKLRDKSANPLGLMYTGLCHDLGKPKTWEDRGNDKITFYGHEKEGVEVANKLMRRLTNETKLIKYVKNLTRYHMYGHKILELRDAKLRKLMVDVDISELLLITEADEKGRGVKVEFDSKRIDYINRIEGLSNGEFGKVEPYFKGSDLINMGYKQGKELGDVLKIAYDNQLNGDSKDKIERMIMKKVGKKPTFKGLDVIVDEELSSIVQNNKKNISDSVKRLEFFKYLKTKNNVKGKEINFKSSVNKIPYIEVISLDRKHKYLITPLYVSVFSVDDTKRRVVFSTFDDNIEYRKNMFNKILGSVNSNISHRIEFLSTVYGRLPNREYISQNRQM